jgi:hypothetical protein
LVEVARNRDALKGFFPDVSALYLLARHWALYSFESHGDTYALWLHDNDIPTMQAAHAQNPDLGAYLKQHAHTWSSNYIAADLRVDVWAARVCLDLYGVKTPAISLRPAEFPRAEMNFKHNGVQTQAWLSEGFTVKDIATKLGVTESFLRQAWRKFEINPEFGLERHTEHDPDSAVAQNRAAWVDELRNGIDDTHPMGHVCKRNVESIGEAAHVWGVPYNTAKKRLVKLGWTPHTGVADALGL